ncbi:MAG TPA: xanthine dehydrogenase family protein molybdopterin-binding subunit [Dehalococcoidia bacterium]|nr:xanthine dehydrogenase family protein molybdopterin-binding subunit [Dehalococcoidia bacterium]
MAKKYRFIGKPAPRKDAVEIVTGHAKFVGDIKQHGLLWGKVLRSPHPHANIKNIDTSKAARLPGVRAVLTHHDVPKWKAGVPPHLPMLDSKVRFVGDAVALVAAETEEIAAEACNLIDVEYEQLPAVYDVEEAIKPDAPQLYEQFPGNILPRGLPFFGPELLQEVIMGDVDQGFQEAEIISEGTYAFENIPNPLPYEPPGAIASWDGPDTLNVWVSGQGAYLDRLSVYYTLGRKIKVNAYGGPCGGSYGSKGMSLPVVLYSAILARVTGRPVRVCLSKEEHLNTFALRLGSRIHGRVGMKKDGTITAISGDWLINTGYYSSATQGMVAVGCGEVQLALRCNNWDLRPKVICTNRCASGIVRGFGGQELKCALLPIVTEAMEKLDIDPFEFFKKNYIRPGDGYYWRDSNWYVYRGAEYSKAMDKGAEAFRWSKKWRGWLKPTSVDGSKRRGVGVGVHGNGDTGEDTSEAYVRLDPDGTATIYSSICEHGTGQRSCLCKMVAEVLQLPLEHINITDSDTRISPYEFGPAGSRGTYAIGSAAIAAAEDAKQKLFALSAHALNAKPEDLETEDGMLFIRGNPENRIQWRRGMGVDSTVLGFGRFEADFTLPNFMMTFVEVEVDTETGKVDLLRVVSATDVGQIIDPYMLENQLNGCLGSAGIDSALIEESVLDTNTGRLLTANMVDYKWRTFAELPEMQNVILETPFPSHRFGAIGIGEIATAPGPSAVLMAVSNAIGTRLHSYPITPDKVLAALGKIRGGDEK